MSSSLVDLRFNNKRRLLKFGYLNKLDSVYNLMSKLKRIEEIRIRAL